MFISIIPLMLVMLAPTLQLIFSNLSLKNKIKLSLLAVNLIALSLGLILPFVATFVSMYGFSIAHIKCMTACIGFVFLGLLVTIITFPVIAIVNLLISNKRKAKLSVAIT